MTDTKRVRTLLEGTAAQAGYLTGETVPRGARGDLYEVRLDGVEDSIWLPEDNFTYEAWEPQISFTADGADTPEQAAMALLRWIRTAPEGEEFFVHVENGHGEAYVVRVQPHDGDFVADLDRVPGDPDRSYYIYKPPGKSVSTKQVPQPDPAWIEEAS